jgi:hypothetical protein
LYQRGLLLYGKSLLAFEGVSGNESEFHHSLERFRVGASYGSVFQGHVRADEFEQLALFVEHPVIKTPAELLRHADKPFAVVHPFGALFLLRSDLLLERSMSSMMMRFYDRYSSSVRSSDVALAGDLPISRIGIGKGRYRKVLRSSQSQCWATDIALQTSKSQKAILENSKSI